MTRPLLILVALLAAATSGCSSGPATRMASFEPYDPRPVIPHEPRRASYDPRGYNLQSDDGLILPPDRPRKPRSIVHKSEPAKETVGRSEGENGSGPRVVNTPEWLAKEAAADDRVKGKMIICRGC